MRVGVTGVNPALSTAAGPAKCCPIHSKMFVANASLPSPAWPSPSLLNMSESVVMTMAPAPNCVEPNGTYAATGRAVGTLLFQVVPVVLAHADGAGVGHGKLYWNSCTAA